MLTTGVKRAVRGGVGSAELCLAERPNEVARTVRRVVDKLLHTPTVRIKQLAGAPGGDAYAEALRELFELDPQTVDAVAAGEITVPATEPDTSHLDGTE